MGFPTAPAADPYCPGPGCCDAVYNPGETPLKLYVSYTGIEMGTAVPGVDPPPPNKTFELDFDGLCHWVGGDAPDLHDLKLSPGPTTMTGTGPIPLIYFTDVVAGEGHSFFENDQVNPVFDDYINGTAKIISNVLGGEEVIINAMEDAVIEPDPETFFDFVPVNDDVNILRFSRRFDKTNIHIKYDNS